MKKIKLACNSTDHIDKKPEQQITGNATVSEVNTVTVEKFGMWDYFDNVQKISVVQFLQILKVLNTSVSEFGRRLKK